MNWFDCLLTFEKIVEKHSFIGASRALGTTNSVVTKRIQWLETQLAATLLIRTTRKVTLTESGQFLLSRIEPLLREWQDVQNKLHDYNKQPSGNLAICLPPDISGLPLFVDISRQFLMATPNIRLQVSNTYQPISLIDKNVDILIATEKYLLEPEQTVGIELFKFSYYCYAAPGYLKKMGQLEAPEDLQRHNCLIYFQSNQWEFSNKLISVSGNFQGNSASCLIAACVQGMGLIYMPSFLVQPELKQGLIQRVLVPHFAKQDRLSAFYTKHLYKPRKISIFIDLLCSKFKY